MEGRSLADDTQPDPLAGEMDDPVPPVPAGRPEMLPKATPPGEVRKDAKPPETRAQEKERAKAEKKAEKAEKKLKKGAPAPAAASGADAGADERPEEEPKREGRLSRLRFSKKRDMPGGLWLKCESCSQVIFRKELEEKGRVCPSCGFHFTVPGKERIRMTLDEGSWREQFGELEALDRLNFMDAQPYAEKVRRASERSGQKEALLCGTGTVLGRPVVLAIL